MFRRNRPLKSVNQSQVLFTSSNKLIDISSLPKVDQEKAIITNIITLIKQHFSVDIYASIKKASPDKINFIFYTSGMPYENINTLNLKVFDFLNSFSPTITFEKQATAFWSNTIATVPCSQLNTIYEKLIEQVVNKKLADADSTRMKAKL